LSPQDQRDSRKNGISTPAEDFVVEESYIEEANPGNIGFFGCADAS